MAVGFSGLIKRTARKILGGDVNGREVMYEFSVTREWLVQNKCLTKSKLPSLGRIKFSHGKGHARLWFELYDLSGKFLGEDDREPAKEDFAPTTNSMIIKERKPPKPQFLKSMNLGSHAMPYKKIFESEKFNQLLYQIIYELET